MEWAQWCSDRPGGRDRLTAALAASPPEVVDELIAAHRAGSHEHRIQYLPLTDYQLGLLAPLRCLIGGRVEPRFGPRCQIALASSLNAAPTRRAGGASMPSS
jgi:hypothetical protein